jgi:hypothetical protein
VKKQKVMSKDTTKDWMEKLVKNYQIPEDTQPKKEEPKRMLRESQLKIIMSRDKKDLENKK